MSEVLGTTVADRDEHIVIRIPLTLKRRSGRKEVIVDPPPSMTSTRRRQHVNPLMVAVARAHRWEDLLESGRYGSWVEIAAAQGVDPSYVARILRLTLLAPDIIESVLDGTEPDGLSLGKLYQLPMDWDEQRRVLTREAGTGSGDSPFSV
jgi:hypothetical protein